jgi:hypothetical protein
VPAYPRLSALIGGQSIFANFPTKHHIEMVRRKLTPRLHNVLDSYISRGFVAWKIASALP